MYLTLSQTLCRENFQPLGGAIRSRNQKQGPVVLLCRVVRIGCQTIRRSPKVEEEDRNPFKKQDLNMGYL